MVRARRGRQAVLFLTALGLGPACGARTDTSDYDVPDGGGGQGATGTGGSGGSVAGSGGSVAGSGGTGAGAACFPESGCRDCRTCQEECRCIGVDVPCDVYCGTGGSPAGGTGGTGAVAGTSGVGGSAGGCFPGSACDGCPDCLTACRCRGGGPMECRRACGGTGGAGGVGGTGGGMGGVAGGGTGGVAGSGGFGAACGEQLLGLACTDVALGNTPACQECGFGPCCDPLQRCFADPECAAFVECYSVECGAAPDPQQCLAERCAPCSSSAAVDLFNQVGYCVQNRCPECQ